MLRVLLTYFFILFSWAIYRYFYRFLEPIDELIAKPLIFLVPVFWYIGQYEKGEWDKLGLRWGKVFKDLYIGLGLGALLLAEGLFFTYLRYEDFSIRANLPLGFGGFVGLALATAAVEEILGRGFLYNQLRYYLSGSKAVIFSSLLFVLLHFPIALFILHLSGLFLLVYLAMIFVLSTANCLLLRFSGSLLSPILVHMFWNISIGLFL